MSRKDNSIPTYAIRAKVDGAPRGAGEQKVCAAATWLYRLITSISRSPVAITSIKHGRRGIAIKTARDANRTPIRRIRELRANQLVAHRDAHKIRITMKRSLAIPELYEEFHKRTWLRQIKRGHNTDLYMYIHTLKPSPLMLLLPQKHIHIISKTIPPVLLSLARLPTQASASLGSHPRARIPISHSEPFQSWIR